MVTELEQMGGIQNHSPKKIFFWGGASCTAYRILVPPLRAEPSPPTVEVQSTNHWTAREVPQIVL